MSEFARELTDLVRSLARDVDVSPDGKLTPLWHQVQELGLVGIGIPEEKGGSGGGLADLMVVIRELARAGIATPLVEASTAALTVGMAEQGSFDTVVIKRGVGLDNPASTVDLGIVPFAQQARRVIVVGDVDVAVLALADAAVDPVDDMAGMPAGRVRGNRAACVVSAGVDRETVIARLTLARSASLLGNGWGAHELTRGYVVGRHQFGAPLIKIPAVSASLAQMVVRIRAAQSALDRAVAVCDVPGSPPMQRLGAVASARIAAAQAATVVASTTHQLHGAVGITLEYGLHRYTRALWAQRDADHSERDWGAHLGATAVAVDENTLWDQLTA